MALGMTAGLPVGVRGQRVATKGGRGHPTECGFCAKCGKPPRMSSRKKSSTISFMFIQITNNKPTLYSRGDFSCTKPFCTLTSHQLHGRRGLSVLSPTVQTREVRLTGRGLPTLGQRLGLKPVRLAFVCFLPSTLSQRAAVSS